MSSTEIVRIMKTHSRKTFNPLARWWAAFLSRLSAPGLADSESLAFWRHRVLQYLIAAGLLAAVLIMVPTFVILLSEGRWWMAAIDIAIYAVIAGMMLVPKLTFNVRTCAVLATLYLVGIWVMVNLGMLSGGPAWLFTFAVIAGILLGFRAAVAAIAINALTLAGLGWLQTLGLVAAGQPFFPTLGRALAAGFNFLFLNALVALSIAGLTRGLQAAITRGREARDALLKEVDVRRQAERFLQASEAKYRLLAENLSDILWSLDMAMNLTYVSPAARTLLGWSEEELGTMRVPDVLSPRSLEKAKALVDDLLAVAESKGDYNASATIELEMRRKDGGFLHTEVRGAFMLDESGRPIGILGTARDISERIQAQKEKEALQALLAQSRKMEAIGLLASGVAHDLNNVLSGIVSYPDLLLIDLPDDSPMRRPLETIRKTGNKAAEIVQDLLTLARRGVQTMNAICLNQVVAEHLASPEHREMIGRYPGVTVETELDPEPAHIKGSAIHLKKALMNLVLNAAEAQPNGGRIVIRSHNHRYGTPPPGLSQMPPGAYVCLEVMDCGNGIPESDLQRIFEPFFTRKVMGRSGSGLGLAVVWGTVQDHEGYISVQSKASEGTTFHLYFPVTGDLPVPAPQPHVDLDSCMGKGETILVVDDVVEQRQIAADILTRLGYRAVTAASGEAAIDYLKQAGGAVDALILDMIMPGMDGLETYQAVLELRAGMRALIATGFSETERVKKALSLGVGAYIRKPYMIDDIGPALRKVLS